MPTNQPPFSVSFDPTYQAPSIPPWHHSSDSGQPATPHEKLMLAMDDLWDDSSYPEFNQDDVLRAYRLGYEDGTE